MSFRLGLLNPNTDQHHTDAMAGVARAALPPGSEVVAVTAARGPTRSTAASVSTCWRAPH